ncbi:MAG: asparagine synthetase B, partial [Candidatus Neomarinimicrobiota bacterium]|nr:asparagine synthetase B [Candidatus Neomarinimicrobiota bacterium]
MDQTQIDHLKAYGIAYWTLKQGENIDWLLNFRGGSFMVNQNIIIERELKLRGVYYEYINATELSNIFVILEENNMDMVLLEKLPKIAVYSPPGKQPWDDAVTLALTYAEIDYDIIFDDEVLGNKLKKYDWLHLHHEDFTGQYGKFYKNYHNASWYKNMEIQFKLTAQKHGFNTVHELKKNVALKIKEYVVNGGFMFAMCSATDSFDIALAAKNVDIVGTVYDNSPIDPLYMQKLDFSNSMAFENYNLYTNPMTYEYSTIDTPPSHRPITKGAEADYFTLFEFSAKWDPVPTMLTQNHVAVINGFMGQTTGFNRSTLKKHVLIMGEVENDALVKYIHGNVG